QLCKILQSIGFRCIQYLPISSIVQKSKLVLFQI
ncbi:unnamed protein product, partial [Allacma fusca]